MTPAQRIREAALGPMDAQQSVMGLLGYMTEAYVCVFSRLPVPYPLARWDLATFDERRMFLLFVAESIDE